MIARSGKTFNQFTVAVSGRKQERFGFAPVTASH
jgi:hypothetical protein